MTDAATRAAAPFALIKPKFDAPPSRWYAREVVKTTAKSVYVPGDGWRGQPERIDAERVVGTFETIAAAEAFRAQACAVWKSHEAAEYAALVAKQEAEQAARVIMEAAIIAARQAFDEATREKNQKHWQVSRDRSNAVATLVAKLKGA